MALTSGRSKRIAGEHEYGHRRRLRHHVGAGASADRRRSPQRRRRVEAAHIHAFLHDRARAEKADARHDIGNHAHAAVGAGQMIGEIDEGGGAHRHQHIGAQPGAALPVLPLGADQRAEHEGREQADQRVEKIEELEGVQELHLVLLIRIRNRAIDSSYAVIFDSRMTVRRYCRRRSSTRVPVMLRPPSPSRYSTMRGDVVGFGQPAQRAAAGDPLALLVRPGSASARCR